MRSRMSAESVQELQIPPWETQIKDVKVLVPGCRLITNQMATLLGIPALPNYSNSTPLRASNIRPRRRPRL